MHQRIERKIARALIMDGLRAGYEIAVNDGGEEFPKMSNCRQILETMFSVGEEHLVFYKNSKRSGWVFFVYGNGPDVISDYSTSLEPIMGTVNKLADAYS